jgi:hypothetical protein
VDPLRQARQMNRRRFLIGLPLATVACRTVMAQNCVDPDELSDHELSTRESMEYEQVSSHAGKSCSTCAYFGGKQSDCGPCTILTSTVDATGYCVSWTSR